MFSLALLKQSAYLKKSIGIDFFYNAMSIFSIWMKILNNA